MATPLVSLFVTFGETHSRMLIDWSTEDEAGRNATVRLVRIILGKVHVFINFNFFYFLNQKGLLDLDFFC